MHGIIGPELLTSHFAVRDCEGTNRANIGWGAMDPKSGRHMVLALNSVRAPSFFSPKERGTKWRMPN